MRRHPGRPRSHRLQALNTPRTTRRRRAITKITPVHPPGFTTPPGLVPRTMPTPRIRPRGLADIPATPRHRFLRRHLTRRSPRLGATRPIRVETKRSPKLLAKTQPLAEPHALQLIVHHRRIRRLRPRSHPLRHHRTRRRQLRGNVQQRPTPTLQVRKPRRRRIAHT